MKALNLGELYEYINFVANKDQLGEPVNPDKYALLLRTSNSNYYEAEYEKILALFAGENQKLEVKIFNNTSLFRFLSIKKYDLDNIVNILFNLPEDLGKTITGVAHYNNIWRPAEFLNITEFNTRRYNVLSRSVKRVPIFTEGVSGYNFIPDAIRRVVISYLRKVLDPVFDYCIGIDDDNEYYMPPGSQIIKGGKLYGLYDSDRKLIVDNVVHLSNPTEFPYVSQSVELDWNEEDKIIISDSIIAATSIRSREMDVAQVASQSAAK